MRLILALLLLATTAQAQWIRDGAWFDSIPDPLPLGNGFASFGPTEAEFLATGARRATQAEIDARAAEAQAAAEQAYAAKIAEVSDTASVFRWVLRQHFGEGAETNHAVSEASVAQYFISRRMAGTSADTDASDAILLQQGFSVLAPLTLDGTTWSFPWSMIQ